MVLVHERKLATGKMSMVVVLVVMYTDVTVIICITFFFIKQKTAYDI